MGLRPHWERLVWGGVVIMDHLVDELNHQRAQFLDAWTRVSVELRAAREEIAKLKHELTKPKKKKKGK